MFLSPRLFSSLLFVVWWLLDLRLRSVKFHRCVGFLNSFNAISYRHCYLKSSIYLGFSWNFYDFSTWTHMCKYFGPIKSLTLSSCICPKFLWFPNFDTVIGCTWDFNPTSHWYCDLKTNLFPMILFGVSWNFYDFLTSRQTFSTISFL